MRLMKTTSLAGLMLLLASGCIVVSGGEGGGGGGIPVVRADLTVFYTFGGAALDGTADCREMGVDRIEVEIDGVNVSDRVSKLESCGSFFNGMVIKDLQVGSYDVLVTGIDEHGYALYEMSEARRAVLGEDGGEIDVDVPALYGSLTVWWRSFGAESGSGLCAAADVDRVAAVLYDYDTGALISDDELPCHNYGAVWNFLMPGSYEVVLYGLDSHGYTLYMGYATVSVQANQDTVYDIDLDMVVGDLTVLWRFGGSAACGEVSQVNVKLWDPADNLYETAVYPCASGGVVYRDLFEGEWLVEMDAENSSGRIIYSTGGAVPLDVLPGENNEYYVDLY